MNAASPVSRLYIRDNGGCPLTATASMHLVVVPLDFRDAQRSTVRSPRARNAVQLLHHRPQEGART